jgi:hypothetical protein
MSFQSEVEFDAFVQKARKQKEEQKRYALFQQEKKRTDQERQKSLQLLREAEAEWEATQKKVQVTLGKRKQQTTKESMDIKRPKKTVPPWCLRTEPDIFSLSHLNTQEKKLLRPLQKLVPIWGYRSDASQDPLNFESKLHNSDLYYMTDISDVLFRGLQQKYATPMDYLHKLQNATLRGENKEKMRYFLRTFLQALSPKQVSQLQKLAFTNVESNASHWNPWFVAIVIASRILLLLADGKYTEAEQTLSAYKDCISPYFTQKR